MTSNQKISLALFLTLLICNNAFADINSVTITADTLKAVPHCLHYRIKGACYWISPAGVNTTPYVEHYLPDVVITVFNKPNENPWTEMNLILDKQAQLRRNKLYYHYQALMLAVVSTASQTHANKMYFLKKPWLENSLKTMKLIKPFFQEFHYDLDAFTVPRSPISSALLQAYLLQLPDEFPLKGDS